MKTFVLFIYLIVVCSIFIQANEPSAYSNDEKMKEMTVFFNYDKYNKVNDHGQKEGFWCDTMYNRIRFTYYRDGKKNGFFILFDNPGYLRVFAMGRYENDVQVGQWHYFYDEERISFTQDSIGPNTFFLEDAYRCNFSNPKKSFQSYTWEYDKTGRLTGEGWCIYEDEVELADKVGTWIYYSPDGKKRFEKY